MNELELEIFRAGDYGPKGRWSEADLDRLAADYDPALHEAPVTLDHAQTGPALGWVASISRQGDRLVARLRGLSGGLMTLLRDGAFKKRSVEIYRALPESGEPYLKAVSFLGAAAPAVKGLRDVLFSEVEPLAQLECAPADFTSFELDATAGAAPSGAGFPACDPCPADPREIANESSRMKSASGTSTDGSAECRLGNSSSEDSPHFDGAPSSVRTTSDSAHRGAGFPACDSPASSADVATPPALAFADIAEPLRRAGRWLPAWEERGLRCFFGSLASAPAFAPRPGETITPQRWFADFLVSLPQSIPMGEAAAPSPASSVLNGMISSVDRASPDSLELHRRVLMLRDSRPHLSYAEALREVARH